MFTDALPALGQSVGVSASWMVWPLNYGPRAMVATDPLAGYNGCV